MRAVGFAGGEALEPEAGLDEDFDEGLLGVAGGEFEKFVGDAGDDWQNGEAEGKVHQEGLLFWNESVEDDADKEDEKNKAGAAAWVEAGHLGGVVWIERQVGFVVADRFVFGAVVFKNAGETGEK